MRAPHLLLGTVVGAFVFTGAVVYIGGILAALSVPRGYFSFFGRENAAPALAILNLATWALPVGAIVFLCSRVALAMARRDAKTVAWGILIGMLAAFIYWHLPVEVGWIADQPLALASALIAPFAQAPWWSVPNLVAPWLGALLAAHLVVGSNSAS